MSDALTRTAPNDRPANSQHSVGTTSILVASGLLGFEVDHTSRDGDGGFVVGQTVRVSAYVRPRRYAGRTGTITVVARVVPEHIVRDLHRQGRTTSNGDVEVGVRFGRPTSHTPPTWFLPRELTVVQVGQSRPESPCAPLRAPAENRSPAPGSLHADAPCTGGGARAERRRRTDPTKRTQ
jgi:hypothetical protein